MTSRMEFDCKLAHDDEVRTISGFSSVRELYDRISIIFDISIGEVSVNYCRLHRFSFVAHTR